jgi:hypothetical protein
MLPVEKQSKGFNSIKGGKRSGAGRKKGVPNKRTAEIQEAVEASGLTPLEYMLQVLRDVATEPRERLAAAVAAAPYVHAKLASVELKGSLRLTKTDLSDEDLAAIATGRSS